jgi:amino acid permease
MAANLRITRLVTTGFVLVHLAASFWHGNAHTRLGIDLPPEQNVFIYIVILIAPLLAATLLWTRNVLIGRWIFFLSMVGSFLFGVYHHYLIVSPDNIRHLPAGSPEVHSQFITSAAVIALLELVAALYGFYCLRRYRAHPRNSV